MHRLQVLVITAPPFDCILPTYYFSTTLFLDALNTGNNVTGIKVLNNSIVTVENESISTTKENGRSDSITDQSLTITTVSEMSDDVVVDRKDESKDEKKEGNSEGKIVEVGENVIETAGATAEESQGVTSAMRTTDNVEEMGDSSTSVEEGKEGGEGQGQGGDDDSNKKRKRSESCVDESVTLPPNDKENIDDVTVTDTNDTVLTSVTEIKNAADSENKAIESDSALVSVKKDEKDENKVEKSRVEVDKSKSNAIITAPTVRSFPVRQSALTDRSVITPSL